MAGVLQFTLGLETSKFLSQIGLSSGSILSLAGVAKGLGAVFDQVGEKIRQGAALDALSKRTGASVAGIFQLQKAFAAVGLSSDAVAPSLAALNRALGGINDAGEDTKSVFAAVGLSVKALEAKGPAAAFRDILEAMSKMDQTTAAAFSSKVFGRGISSDMVQASRSLAEFNATIADSGPQARAFQRVAALFNDIANAFEKLKDKLAPIWMVIAEKVGPELKRLLDYINAFDLQPLANKLGRIFDAFKASFGTSDFSELLRLSVGAALEQSQFYAAKFAATFGAALAAAIPPAIEAGIKASEMVLLTLGEKIQKARLEKLIRDDKEELRRIEASRKSGRDWFLPKGVEDTIRQRIQSSEEALGDLTAGSRQARRQYALAAADNMQKAIQDAISAAADTFKNFGAAPTQALDALRQKIAEILAKTSPSLDLGGVASFGGSNFDLQTGKAAKASRTKVSDLERMGFVFSGGMSRGPEETTARNTTQLVNLARAQLGAIGRLLIPQTNT